MRDRRRPRGPGGDAFTNRKARHSSETSPTAVTALDERESRDAIIAEHSEKVKMEQRRIMGEDKAIWDCRCSSSIFAALLIWACLGFCIVTVIARKEVERTGSSVSHRSDHQQGSHAARGDSPAHFTSRVPYPAAGEEMEDVAALSEGCKGHHCLEDGGSEAFGVVLGSHAGVKGFSNCYANTCISMLEHRVELRIPTASSLADPSEQPDPHQDPVNGTILQRMVTGMKWQCVEYARRYWMLRGEPKPAFFGSVESAADIWDSLDFVTYLDGTTTPLLKFGNGQAVAEGGSGPRVGDLLIYPRDTEERGAVAIFPFGHVAVVVQVDEAAGLVFIAEQNWSSQPWPGPFHNYSRQLKLIREGTDRNTAYTVHDPYHAVKGWVRYTSSA